MRLAETAIDYEARTRVLRGADKEKFEKISSNVWYGTFKSKNYIRFAFLALLIYLLFAFSLSILNNITIVIFLILLSTVTTTKIKLDRNQIYKTSWKRYLKTKIDLDKELR